MTVLVTNGVSLSYQQPTSLNSCFDPAVEFLELGLTCNGQTTWKLYGPDVNGVYGGMQGVGGLESVQTELDPPVDLLKDARGNITYYSETGSGSLWWNTSRPTGFGAIPGFEPPPFGFGSSLGEAAAWRGKWKDITGLYWLGARYYNPESGSFLSSDPVWNAGDPNYYTFCGGDPINHFDPDGRCVEGAGTAVGGLITATANLVNNTLGATAYALASPFAPDWAYQNLGGYAQGLANTVAGTAQFGYNVAATATYGLISPVAPDFAYNNYGGSVQQLMGQAPALYGGNNQSLPYQIGYGAVNAATMLLGGEEAEAGSLGQVGELTEAGAQAARAAEETQIGFHATAPANVDSILANGLYDSAGGRLGGAGVYVNNTPEGAIAEYMSVPGRPAPTVLQVQYNSGLNYTISPPPAGYTTGPLPFAADTLTSESIRLPGTFNTIIRNGSATVVP